MGWWGNSRLPLQVQEDLAEGAPTSGSGNDAMDGLKTLRPSQGERPVKDSSTRPTSSGKLLQLTPLWEQVVKTQRLPPDVDVSLLFAELGVRLHDPEWQVRQHALRVLVDVIPALRTPAELDLLMKPVVLPELVAGLGHAAPAVRKAALDTLRVYLAHSSEPEEVLRAIVSYGLEKPVHPNVPMGVILSIPTLLFPLVAPQKGVIISQQGLVHLVSALSKRLVQVTYQEQALRALVKVRDMVGEARFDHFLEGFHPQCKRDFDILCQVYDVRSALGDSGIDLQLIPGEDILQDEQGSGYWSEESSPVPPTSSSTPQSEDSLYHGHDQHEHIKNGMEDPLEVVLRPMDSSSNGECNGEIPTQPPTGSERNSSLVSEEEDSETDNDATSEEKDEDASEGEDDNRKPENTTPQENEIEVVDESAVQSADTGTQLVPSGRVILETEIKFSEETAITMTILEENEANVKERHFYIEHDESLLDGRHYNDFVMKVLTDDEYYNDDDDVQVPEESIRRTPRRVRFGGEMVVMRTPDSDMASEPEPSGGATQEEQSKQGTGSTEVKQEVDQENQNTSSKNWEQTSETVSEVEETFHDSLDEMESKPEGNVKVDGENGTTVSSELYSTSVPRDSKLEKTSTESQQFLSNNGKLDESAKIAEASQKKLDVRESSESIATKTGERTEATTKVTSVSHIPIPIVPAFHRPRPARYGGQVYRRQQVKTKGRHSPVTNVDGGESLTCSSSESEQQGILASLLAAADANQLLAEAAATNWEDVGLVSQSVVEDLRNKESWRVRMSALEELSSALQEQERTPLLASCLPSLLHLLLVTLAEDRNHRVALGALSTVKSLIQRLPVPLIRRYVSQLTTGLSRRAAGGGSSSVALRIEAVQTLRSLMQRVGPSPVLDALLAPSCLSARSSKVRESALLCVLFAAMTFPSSQLDASTMLSRVLPTVGDPRRRVRQAALDTVAVLAQFVSPPAIETPLLIAADAQATPKTRDGFIAAVHARLARRQLPALSPDGLIMYALQIPVARSHPPPANITGEDVEWILAGTGSLSSGSARSRGQLLAAQRAASPPADSRSSLLSSNPWGERRPQELVAVGLGVGPSPGGPQQLTWALVPVSSLPTDEQKDGKTRGSSPWTADLAASNGGLRPLYLRLQPTHDDIRYHRDKGMAVLPTKAYSEKMNQTWPPPSPAMSPRVLTPSQHRGRRILEPIGSLQDSGGSVDEPFPRRATPVQARNNVDANNRHRIPPLAATSDAKNYQESEYQVVDEEAAVRRALSKSRSEKGRSRRRHRARTSSKEQQNHMTPPSLLDVSNTECTIPQKPMLARPTIRQELSAALRPDSSGLFTPPAEPFLPPVDTATSSPQTHHAPVSPSTSTSAPPLALLSEQLEFRSLDETDDAPEERTRPLLHSHMLSKSLPARALMSLEAEEKERAFKFRQLKAIEYESVSAPERSQMPPSTTTSLGTATALEKDITYLESVSSTSAPAALGAEIVSDRLPEQEKLPTTGMKSSEELPVLTPEAPLPISSPSVDHNTDESPGHTDTVVNGTAITNTTGSLKRTRRALHRPPLTPSTNVVTASKPNRLLRGALPRDLSRGRTAGQQKASGTFPDSLRPLDRPREAMQQCFQHMESAEWELNMQGLQMLVRLLRHHPEVPQANLHAVTVALGRQVRNLRSQVSRAACQACGELFDALRRAVETDLEEVVGPLFHRSADTNKFLRADCNAALDKMVEAITPARAVTVIVAKGASHQNAIVRTAAARLLTSIVTKLGTERVMLSPKEIRDKILITGASLLMEGSLDTRCYAKQLFRCLASHNNFNAILTEVLPPPVLRNISKTLQNLK